MLSSLIIMAAVTSVTAPEKFLASSERWGYTGTIRVYNTYADAVAGKNARTAAISVPHRDGALYVARNMGGEYSEYNAFLTNWYSTTETDPNKKGWGNPNNKNEGFVQMYDADASNWQNQKAYWDAAKNTFTLEAKGMRASYPSVENPGDYARLWNAGSPPASGEGTKGTFLRYEYKLVATGLAGDDSDHDGLIENTQNATGYTGYFRAIFQNESVRHPESNGFYEVSLTIGAPFWAALNNLTQPDEFASANLKR